MRSLEAVDLVPGGIPGDRHFSPGSRRELLLIEAETLEAFGLHVGDVKENVTVRGIRLMDLEPGARIGLGEAEVELTGVCEPCSRMDELRAGLQAELQGRRGMVGRVVTAGRVSTGDPVRVLAPATPGAEPEPAER
jgi:MOSC domain-containing protein YiiM